MNTDTLIPRRVALQEVSLRDGLQNEATILTTEQKVHLVNALAACGLSRIEVSSFVSPRVVPQMADAEEVWDRIERDERVLYSALVLDERGLDRAIRRRVPHVGIWVSASETHSRKNSNRTLTEATDQALVLIEKAKNAGMLVRAGVMCAFGCAYEGDVPQEGVVDIIRRMKVLGPEEISLADTAGMANPLQVDVLVRAVRECNNGEAPSLHLHNTRGLGMANAYAALLQGVTIFDTSLGGVGGCPFIQNAAGNIATEDMVHMLESMGVRTGVDRDGLMELSLQFQGMLGKKLPSVMAGLCAGRP